MKILDIFIYIYFVSTDSLITATDASIYHSLSFYRYIYLTHHLSNSKAV